MGGWTAELRYILRKLARAPVFAGVAVATLAVGIGANSAIFGLVHAALLRPLPYPEPDRLVMVWQDFSRRGGAPRDWFSPGNFIDWRDQVDAFSAMGAFGGWGPTLAGDDQDPESLAGGVVSAGFLDLLGARPALGRLFTRAEEATGAEHVVVLGDGLWRRRFGADPDIVGRTIHLGGDPYRVVGVLAPGFSFPLLPGTDVFTPLTLDPAAAPRGAIFIRAVARLAPGVSLERAGVAATAEAARLEQAYPRANTGVGAAVQPLREALVGDARPALLVLLAGVGAVLLIACVNLAGLLIARSAAQRREHAVRTALGAPAYRIARLQLLESGVLAVVGALLGLLVSSWLMALMVAASPLGLPPLFSPALGWSVAGFTLLVGLVAGVGFGLAPAVRAARPDVVGALRGGERGNTVRARGRQLLVAAQVALALVLLVAAGLLGHSFLRLRAVDPGFDPNGLISFQVNTPQASYPEPEQVATFYRELTARVKALPGVAAAGVVSSIPFSGGDTDVNFVIEGEPAPEPGKESVIWYRQATPGYLATMGIPVLRGRGLTAEDRSDAPRSVVLSEAAAEHFFPGQDPVGRRLKPGSDPERDSPWWTVVGVVGGVHQNGLAAAPKYEMYLPEAQAPSRQMTVVVRASRGSPASLVPALRRTVAELDPNMAVSGIATLDAMISGSLAEQRFVALCLGVFAVLALTLSALGLYGVLSQVVGGRTRELGVRIALGADPGDVVAMVLRQGAALVALGAVAGVVGAVAISRVLAGMLFGITPFDPPIYLALVAVLASVALVASWLPARRAARVDPMHALRTE